MINFAINYLKKGLSILPVGQDKKPLVAWKEYQTRLATEQEAREWWIKYPTANIGIITGKISGITVVDIEKGGDSSIFPETNIVKTGGGGWHYYYRYEESMDNKARILPLVDIRGNGGYVVAPPSIHQSGQRYEVLKDKILAPFPLELFGEKRKEFNKQDWQRIVSGLSQGERNENATKIVGKLLSSFKKEEWETAVYPLLVSWNTLNNPPMEESELRSVYLSIARREIMNKREIEVNKMPEDIEFVKFTDLLSKSIEDLKSVKEENVISFGYDWLDEKMTGIFPSELIVMGGETGTGKSTFATNIIYKASKKHKCGVFALEDRLLDYGIKALYFEIGRLRKNDGFKNYPWNEFRKNNIKDNNYDNYTNIAFENLKNDNIYFADVKKQIDIDILEKLIEKKVYEGFDLFLIDHLHYFNLLKGDSSKADYIESLMIKLKLLQNRSGAKIILVVHYRKLDGRKPTLDSFKDSISIVQNANYVINLWRDRSIDAERFKTHIIIPKSRNPNGEATIEVLFDPSINDYIFEKDIFGSAGYDEEKKEININQLNF